MTPGAHALAIQADPRWAAVLARDARADGAFCYAVRTTGVYCRPSCGARTPLPDNVEFHPTAAAAQAAGFRPCRRCRPDLPPLAQRQGELVGRLCQLIESAETPPDLATLAAHAGLSPHHTHRIFKAHTGLTPKAYASALRARRLQSALPGSTRVVDAVLDAGYGSTAPLYGTREQGLGMTPGTFRRGGRGEHIRFATGRCSLGWLLVGATARGICTILLGDDTDALNTELHARFPHATLSAAGSDFSAWVSQVITLVEHPECGLQLPLDLRGTLFQQRVWHALCAVPPGERISYTELAKRVGRPGSVRAIANACAANRLAVAVPCHRAVRQDGGLAGYRWGLARKKALLEREAWSLETAAETKEARYPTKVAPHAATLEETTDSKGNTEGRNEKAR